MLSYISRQHPQAAQEAPHHGDCGGLQEAHSGRKDIQALEDIHNAEKEDQSHEASRERVLRGAARQADRAWEDPGQNQHPVGSATKRKPGLTPAGDHGVAVVHQMVEVEQVPSGAGTQIEEAAPHAQMLPVLESSIKVCTE